MTVATKTKEEILDKLDDLATLELGWYDDYSQPISRKVLDFVRENIDILVTIDGLMVGPTFEGDISLEWDSEDNYIFIDVSAVEGLWMCIAPKDIKSPPLEEKIVDHLDRDALKEFVERSVNE